MIFKVPKSYYDATRPHMHQVINPESRKILDLGCGAGAFGQSIKERSESVIVWGIERNSFLADCAGSKLDHVIHAKIKEAVSLLPDNYFDTITFDAVEREKHPHRILKSLYEKLVPGGEIVTSALNLRQWPVIRNLLEGSWEYEYYGIMERDHYRFFTKKSLIDLLNNSSYKIVCLSCEFWQRYYIDYIKIPDQIMDALSRTDVDISSLEDDSSTFRYTVKAIKPSIAKDERHKDGERLIKLGKYDMAKRHYSSLNAESPYSVETLYGLALCSLRMKNFQTAFKEFQSLLERHPDYAPALNQLAILHCHFGNLTTARSMLLKAIMNDPMKIQFQLNYGQVLVALKEYDMAELVFQNIHTNHPDCLWAHHYIQTFLLQIKNHDQEIDSESRIIDVDPDNQDPSGFSQLDHLGLTLSCPDRCDFNSRPPQSSQNLAESELAGDMLIQNRRDSHLSTIANRQLKKEYGIDAQECLKDTVIPICHRKTPAKYITFSDTKKGNFFVNSIAKGGTNLLTKVLSLFPGISHSNIVISRGAHLEDLPMGGYGSLPVGRDGYLGKPSVWNCQQEVPIDADSPNLENIEKVFYILTGLSHGTFATGHIPYSDNFSLLLSKMEIKSFLILRDPRDVVVSHALFVSRNPYNEYFGLYRHLTVDDQIMTSIKGIREGNEFGLTLQNIRQRLESLLPWQYHRNTCTVFFEHLVGPKGGGSLELQLKTLTKIAEHLNISLSPRELETMSGKVFGGSQTFRKGSIGSWKAYLKKEHKTILRELVGAQLISLGYEKDDNW